LVMSQPDITFCITMRCIWRDASRLLKTTNLFMIPGTTLDRRFNIAIMPAFATGSGFIVSMRRARVSFWPATSAKEVAVAPGHKTVTLTP